MELSYCILRSKNVVNTVDGKNLGRIRDIFFDECGQIKGFSTPGETSGIFGVVKSEGLFIPWKNICKIGEDVILVKLGCNESKSHNIDENN